MAEKLGITKINYYIDLVLRRRWIIIISFCFCMVAGIYLAFTLPKIYQTRTLILIEPQRVPSDYVKTIVTSDIQSRISTIEQQILSRTNLEKIIAEFGIFSEPEHQWMFREDKIENLRKSIKVQVTRARGGSDAFSISFKGKVPQTVKDIARD
jgi:uncharacterized protein involved in exopolysaccharide biosynthesis